MPDLNAEPVRTPTPDPRLAQLQQVIYAEIPICQKLGVVVEGMQDGALIMSCPLELNHNHQATAFAGSLNALCTIAGWSVTHLEAQRLDDQAVIVIRRSSIKYHRPVDSPSIVARCLLPTEEQRAYFAEMLAEKGQAKLDLVVEIDHGVAEDRARVVFTGSYVATAPETA
ncbi:putative thioesterase [Posidoniimonas polymericola]|uniref:Putative thioesterase n=1 Tax=Posidoniimonas polymericola TaxID=2528002 RepID=A0A5C5YI64_9BACT|nr:YiiD C-terminal domain-containing protein [Posidoniimonas polymericola]TWT74482.1 putative thioesterase [Posidoniimonas polymericola]